MNGNAKKTAYLGLFSVLALVFSYIETLIPFNFGIPGIKLGLANIVTLAVLYIYGFKESFAVLICRIIVAGLLFGNMYGIIYSLFGGLLSITGMYVIKRLSVFNMLSVSITGGVLHNMGQLIVAALTVSQLKVFMYGPVLIISGLITGILIGIAGKVLIKTVETYVRV